MIGTIVITILMILVIKLLWTYINAIINLKNYPPGPFPLPIIGNLNVMSGPKMNERLRKFAEKYGDVFSLSFGLKRVVIVNSVEPAREALITKSAQFAGRPNDLHTQKMLFKGFKGVLMSDYSNYWKLMRKLSHSALKMYGDGIAKIEEKVVKESEELRGRLEKQAGKAIDLHHELSLAVMNVICNMIFGHRYEIDDAEFDLFHNMVNLVQEGSKQGNPVAYIPFFKYLAVNKTYEALKKAIKIRDDLIGKKLLEHINTFDPENIRDFTDSLIKYSRDPSLFSNTNETSLTNDHLEMIIFDFFLAGADTTFTTLKWAVLYLIHYPQYQDILYDEIREAIGTKRYPDYKDRKSLPLFQAALQEVLRLSSIAELGIPRKAVQDGTIGGKNIPKGTIVLFNFWNLHHDERVWENPFEFNPYRWLDEENNYVPGKHKSFLPFSAGGRSCVGEALAKTELFLFLSRLVCDFRFEPNMKDEFPKLERIHGIVCAPKPFTVILTPRKELPEGTKVIG